MIRAYEMPLDDLLHSLGETFGFAVQVDCGTEACPPFSGRLSGGLEAVLGLVLLGRNYSLIHGAPAEPGGPTRLESLAVLAGPRAPDESLPDGPTWGDGPAITVWETNPVPPPGQQPDGELGGEPGVEGVYWLADRYTRRFDLDGVVVQDVVRGSQAARLGFEGLQRTPRGRYVLGDRILEVGGQRVDTVNQLRDAFEEAGVGESIELTIERDGRRRTVRIELQRVG